MSGHIREFLGLPGYIRGYQGYHGISGYTRRYQGYQGKTGDIRVYQMIPRDVKFLLGYKIFPGISNFSQDIRRYKIFLGYQGIYYFSWDIIILPRT